MITNKQKIVLNLINKFGNSPIERIKLFKLSFLLSCKIKGFYSFIPYKYGPYSFELEKDINFWQKNGILQQEKNNKLKSLKEINLKSTDNTIENEINVIYSQYQNKSTKYLIDLVYSLYPYYTLNSKIYKNIKKYKSSVSDIAIYTIGYEGFSIDEFINLLIKKGIKTVIDVRNKPYSYKYGFSYYWLKKYLSEVDLEYISIPELGIQKELRIQFSGEVLWEKYKKILNQNESSLTEAINLITKIPSVLMCFEKDYFNCHRHVLSEKIEKITGTAVHHYTRE
ncbi:MAG: DUF488 family protein [Candidatus Firestonebacteria bacterium]